MDGNGLNSISVIPMFNNVVFVFHIQGWNYSRQTDEEKGMEEIQLYCIHKVVLGWEVSRLLQYEYDTHGGLPLWKNKGCLYCRPLNK